jgi:hypothetical protein
MIQYIVQWLNDFPPLSGISQTYSSPTFMMGTALDLNNHCIIPFGAYVEAHEDYDRTHTMAERTKGTICLGPTANFQGSYKILCLKTARKVTRKKIKELPMSASVIKRIEEISEREKRSEGLLFTNRNSNKIHDIDEEHDTVTTCVDNETGNETRDYENKPDNQPIIMNDNEQPGITLESEEPVPQIHPEKPGVDHSTNDTVNDVETTGLDSEDDQGKTTGVFDSEDGASNGDDITGVDAVEGTEVMSNEVNITEVLADDDD